MTTIDNSNYERYLLRYAEHELAADEAAAVEAYLAVHPEAAAELELYASAPHLEADPSVTFGDRERLRHRVVALPERRVWRWAAAAAVLLVLLVPVLLPRPTRQPVGQPVAMRPTFQTAQPGNLSNRIDQSDQNNRSNWSNRSNQINRNNRSNQINQINQNTPATSLPPTTPTPQPISTPDAAVEAPGEAAAYIEVESLIVFEEPDEMIATNELIVASPSFRRPEWLQTGMELAAVVKEIANN